MLDGQERSIVRCRIMMVGVDLKMDNGVRKSFHVDLLISEYSGVQARPGVQNDDLPTARISVRNGQDHVM